MKNNTTLPSITQLVEMVRKMRRSTLQYIQVNVGKVCNQTCTHCHMNAGPSRKEVMGISVMDEILSFASGNNFKTLDITGGAPELNPNFRYLVKNGRELFTQILVRSNLTVLLGKGMEEMPEFYRDMGVELIASLPCYLEENVDTQRGKDTYSKSIQVLKKLNKIGYGIEGTGLSISLVYNSNGASLPPAQKELEAAYKEEMLQRHGITFNNLYTITNIPIKRFREKLKKSDKLEEYFELLEQNFNIDTVSEFMCRKQINIGYDGKVYDCDFNQAAELPLWQNKTIGDISKEDIREREITTKKHCLACAAGAGSSCGGALKG